jgi:hypothetical protein
MLSNFEKWRAFMSGIPSPDCYINFGFYYLIAAALQRRCWVGPDHQKLFPNQYVILVGEPGLGKGLVINQINNILRYHKLENPSNRPQQINGAKHDAIEDAVGESNYEKATIRKSIEKPLLIPVAADSTTYEALVTAMARSTRGISYRAWSDQLQKHVTEAYLHCSLCFCLEEISSLFRKKSEDTVQFTIKTYDCGDYEKDTKTQDQDVIKRSCLNLIGGTTPTFVAKTFDDHILNDGFSSRVWWILATSNRFNTLNIPELTEEQKQYQKDIIDHVKKLTQIYGHIGYEPDALEYLTDWWQNVHPKNKPNVSPKLIPYYARKNIHVQKLAMAHHFGEDADINENKQPLRKISLQSCKSAMAMLDDAEHTMHLALSFEGQNPLAIVGKKILRLLKNAGPYSTKDLQAEFWDDCKTTDMNEILDFLAKQGKIELFEPTPTTKKWKLKE